MCVFFPKRKNEKKTRISISISKSICRKKRNKHQSSRYTTGNNFKHSKREEKSHAHLPFYQILFDITVLYKVSCYEEKYIEFLCVTANVKKKLFFVRKEKKIGVKTSS